jgi:hypothetical protein
MFIYYIYIYIYVYIYTPSSRQQLGHGPWAWAAAQRVAPAAASGNDKIEYVFYSIIAYIPNSRAWFSVRVLVSWFSCRPREGFGVVFCWWNLEPCGWHSGCFLHRTAVLGDASWLALRFPFCV